MCLTPGPTKYRHLLTYLFSNMFSHSNGYVLLIIQHLSRFQFLDFAMLDVKSCFKSVFEFAL